MPRQLIPAYEVINDILGTGPAAGGSIQTYEVGTTDDKQTTADYDGLIPNPNPVPLDSSGRVTTPIWGDGAYTLVIRNADDEVIKTLESRPEQAAGASIPVPSPGEFLTGDGSNFLTQLLQLLPDPAGASGRVLSNDGANPLWVTVASILAGQIPEAPTLDVVVGTNSLRIGDGVSTAKWLLQVGTDSISASGQNYASKSVSFPTAYSESPYVIPVPTISAANGSGWLVMPSVTSASTTGFSLKVETNAGNDNTGKITNTITFVWVALGRVIVA